MKPIITLQHVSKNFKNYTALADVCCSVSQGEIFGLLGPSGAGKTTIINILTGQKSPTKGEATIFDTNTNKLTSDIYSKIGMVLDDSGLYTRLTCYDNLQIFADIYGLGKEDIASSVKSVQMTDTLKQPVSKLSKGMKQRLVLARAILHKPVLLFLDEPTSGLDPATALEIHQLILDLRSKGTTIFLTTHNMAEASKLCDHVALLNKGKIVEYGEPGSLCHKYNQKQIISILLKNGQQLELPNNRHISTTMMELFEKDLVAAVHSSEPDLETVFIILTGRKFV